MVKEYSEDEFLFARKFCHNLYFSEDGKTLLCKERNFVPCSYAVCPFVGDVEVLAQ